MTAVKISNFKTTHADFGFIASFDALVGPVLIRGLTLMRPDSDPDKVWLSYPCLARAEGRHAVWLTSDIRAEVARRAAAVYEAATGISLAYVPPPVRTRHAHMEAVAATIEPDDAGLRRVIGETMERAGL